MIWILSKGQQGIVVWGNILSENGYNITVLPSATSSPEALAEAINAIEKCEFKNMIVLITDRRALETLKPRIDAVRGDVRFCYIYTARLELAALTALRNNNIEPVCLFDCSQPEDVRRLAEKQLQRLQSEGKKEVAA